MQAHRLAGLAFVVSPHYIDIVLHSERQTTERLDVLPGCIKVIHCFGFC